MNHKQSRWIQIEFGGFSVRHIEKNLLIYIGMLGSSLSRAARTSYTHDKFGNVLRPTRWGTFQICRKRSGAPTNTARRCKVMTTTRSAMKGVQKSWIITPGDTAGNTLNSRPLKFEFCRNLYTGQPQKMINEIMRAWDTDQRTC